jgi:hypothetical protein
MFHLSPKLTSLPGPVDVDIERLMATSKLIQGFPPLATEAAINHRIAQQKKQKAKGGLVDTNLVIFGRGTVVSLIEQNTAATATPPPADATPTPSPTPAPH